MYPIYYGGGVTTIMYALMSVLSFIFSNILLGVELIGCWFTFKKMDLPGWKGIIPIYNIYVLFEELWEIKYFWRGIIYAAVFAVSFIIGEILFAIGGIFSYTPYPDYSLATTSIVLLIIGIMFFVAALVTLIMSFVVFFKIYHKTAKAFGLKTAWVWGMIFVPYIIFPIIGFNRKIVYYGQIHQE